MIAYDSAGEATELNSGNATGSDQLTFTIDTEFTGSASADISHDAALIAVSLATILFNPVCLSLMAKRKRTLLFNSPCMEPMAKH